MAIEDMVEIGLDGKDDPPQSEARPEGDNTPLVSSMSVGGGMVAFEFSSGGENGVIGDDMVLDDDLGARVDANGDGGASDGESGHVDVLKGCGRRRRLCCASADQVGLLY